MGTGRRLLNTITILLPAWFFTTSSRTAMPPIFSTAAPAARTLRDLRLQPPLPLDRCPECGSLVSLPPAAWQRITGVTHCVPPYPSSPVAPVAVAPISRLTRRGASAAAFFGGVLPRAAASSQPPANLPRASRLSRLGARQPFLLRPARRAADHMALAARRRRHRRAPGRRRPAQLLLAGLKIAATPGTRVFPGLTR